MPERFVSDPIQPLPNSFDTKFMARGVPGLPREFFWHDEKFVVSEVIRVWRTTGPCHHGSGEQYTRRHWFEVKAGCGKIMVIYFNKGSGGKRKEMGWYLFSIKDTESN